MSVNINYLFTRFTVLTVLLTTVQPSTTTKCGVLHMGNTPPLYCNVTANGNSKGAPCVFPFFYNGSYYDDCVSVDHSNPWCSTTDNYTRDGQWGECLTYDICQYHNTLSDPWRNTGCQANFVSNWQNNDTNLQEGWYHFRGISGDRMANPCFRNTSCDASDLWPQDSVMSLDCGGGLILYYLVPVDGVYKTRHSSCTASSCGLNTSCNPSDGSCSYTNADCINIAGGYHTIKDNVTANGNSKGAPCVFPLFYKGSYYDDCVSVDHSNPWCSTTDNYTRDGQWGECLDYDVCKYHKTLSNVWRNIGCTLNTFKNKDDKYLQEGWYRFTGFGGDRMAYPCINRFDCRVRDERNWLQQSALNLDCGGGLILYYLVPIDGVYMTRHSSCPASSCGLKSLCDSYNGRCDFNPTIDNKTTGDYSKCTDMDGIYDGTYDTTTPESIPYMLNQNPNEDMDVTHNDTTTPGSIIYMLNLNLDEDMHGNHDGTYDGPYDDTVNTNGKSTKKPGSSVITTMTHNDTEVGHKVIKKCLAWVNGSCKLIPINSNHTKCSCVNPPALSDNNKLGFNGEPLDFLIVVAMPVGLLFLSLTLLTFVLCRRQMNVNNTAQIHLCISLLLAHLFFLFRGGFFKYISANQLACTVLPGLLHFLFLSAFVWMLIDAVLLFISARNLTKIRSRQKQILGWKSLTVIGYVIPLIVVGVSVAVIPNGYGGKKCWFKSIRGFSWSFLGPACFILAANVILFIAIFITVTFSLKGLNNEILQRTQTQDDRKLIRTVLFKTMAQFFILGCPWILGLINSSSIVLETIYVVLISQQGTFIFLVHCVLNQEVRQQYRKWLCTFCSSKKPTTIDIV